MNTKNITLVLFLLVALGGLYVLKNLNRSKPEVASVTSTITDNNSSTSNEREFTVTGANFSFDPKVINVKKGDQVKIIFKNNEGFHDFRLDEFNVATKQIKANESDSVTFTADKVGTFEYYCTVGKHRQMGMVGQFTVTN